EEQDSSQYWKPPVYYFDDDDDFFRESIDETPPSDAIAPVLPITDSFVMENEHLDTIPETDSDEEIYNNMQTQTSNTLHNAIMEAGSKDRPPMLAPGNYVQWKSRIKRYIDTKPNHELIHYCLTNPPYELGWKEKFVLDSEGNPTTITQRVFETYKNVTQDIRDQLNAKAKAV
nr:hypothetical protein [Tanacetum cinerariifolium]